MKNLFIFVLMKNFFTGLLALILIVSVSLVGNASNQPTKENAKDFTEVVRQDLSVDNIADHIVIVKAETIDKSYCLVPAPKETLDISMPKPSHNYSWEHNNIKSKYKQTIVNCPCDKLRCNAIELV